MPRYLKAFTVSTSCPLSKIGHVVLLITNKHIMKVIAVGRKSSGLLAPVFFSVGLIIFLNFHDLDSPFVIVLFICTFRRIRTKINHERTQE